MEAQCRPVTQWPNKKGRQKTEEDQSGSMFARMYQLFADAHSSRTTLAAWRLFGL